MKVLIIKKYENHISVLIRKSPFIFSENGQTELDTRGMVASYKDSE